MKRVKNSAQKPLPYITPKNIMGAIALLVPEDLAKLFDYLEEEYFAHWPLARVAFEIDELKKSVQMSEKLQDIATEHWIDAKEVVDHTKRQRAAAGKKSRKVDPAETQRAFAYYMAKNPGDPIKVAVLKVANPLGIKPRTVYRHLALQSTDNA